MIGLPTPTRPQRRSTKAIWDAPRWRKFVWRPAEFRRPASEVWGQTSDRMVGIQYIRRYHIHNIYIYMILTYDILYIYDIYMIHKHIHIWHIYIYICVYTGTCVTSIQVSYIFFHCILLLFLFCDVFFLSSYVNILYMQYYIMW